MGAAIKDVTEEMRAHLEAGLGPSSGRIHEIIPDGLRLDIMVFPPHGARRDWVFVTAGMSARDMPGLAPEDRADFARAELMIVLDEAQARAAMAERPEPSAWAPLKMLKSLARFPQTQGTFLSATQTADITGLGLDFAMSEPFTGALFVPPFSFDGDLFRVPLGNGQRLNIYAVIPLFAGELQVKLDKGVEPLFDMLDTVDVSERFDPTRRDASKPEKRIAPW